MKQTKQMHLDQNLMDADRAEKRSIFFRKILSYVILSLGAATTLMPLVWMLSTSFKEKGVVFTYPPEWIPRSIMTTVYNNREMRIERGKIQGEESLFIELDSRESDPGERHALIMDLIPYDHIAVQCWVKTPGQMYGQKIMVEQTQLQDTGNTASYIGETTAIHTVTGHPQYQGLEVFILASKPKKFKTSGITNYVQFVPPVSTRSKGTFSYADGEFSIGTVETGGKSKEVIVLQTMEYKPQQRVSSVLRIRRSDKLKLTVQYVDIDFGELSGNNDILICSKGDIIKTDETTLDINGNTVALFCMDGSEDKQFAIIKQDKLEYEHYGSVISNIEKYTITKTVTDGKTVYTRTDNFKLEKKIKFLWVNYYEALFKTIQPITSESLKSFSVVSIFLIIFKKIPAFVVYFINSLFVAAMVTFLQLSTSSFAAFSFARLKWKGRDALFLTYLATMMIPGQVTLIPVFLLMKRFGLVDTHTALILPAAFTAWGTFMLRQFFLSIPESLVESAHMDGYSKVGILIKIIIPLSKAALATLSVFIFMASWNNFISPLIFINSDYLKTLPVGLQSFQGMYNTEWTLLMAASVIVMIPVLIVYIFNQRFFTKGISMKGIKG